MQLPLQITFRDIAPSPAIEAAIREKAEKLNRFYDRIIGCRVLVEAPHRHHHKGKLYHVRVDLTVPDGELVASRNPDQNHAHEDAYVAVRDAFEAVRRQLEDYSARRRGATKVHGDGETGQVSELIPELDYGRIVSPNGREIYFHRNSVLNEEFDSLSVGVEVQFVETEGEEGPKASTVRVLGKRQPEEGVGEPS